MTKREQNSGPWDKPPRRPGGVVVWLVIAGLVGALVVFLMFLFPEAMDAEDKRISLVRRLGMLAIICASLVMHRRLKPGSALKNLAVWAAVVVVLLLAYNLRDEASALWRRVAADLMPHRGVVEYGAVTFRARMNGHFVVEAEVDGALVRFLVDTGASDVVLSPGDAERLGFDLKALSYSRAYQTANGPGFGAPVRLGRVAIGPVVLLDVRASVNGAPMQNSLLGMSFLGRLSGYEVSGDKLTLRR